MICPVCRATNDAGPSCRRCRGDLSVLFELESAREESLAFARANLGGAEAVAAAEQAERVRSGADAQRLVALAALLHGDFLAAWRAYQKVSTASKGMGEPRLAP